MEVREATHNDLQIVLDYLYEYHADSNLSDVPIDRQSLVKIVAYYIEYKGHLPLIAVVDGKVRGVLFASLEPYFFNAKRYYATDLMFFASGCGPQLWRYFKEWAFESGADRIIMGVSSGDPRAGQLLEVLGMEQTGGMYVLRKESS